MLSPLIIVVLGAPGTGARALSAALQARLAPDVARTSWGHAPHHLRGGGRPPAPAAAPILTLLMGLDLPCSTHRRPAQAAADARLRGELDRAGTTYRVVYGQGEQRTAHALNAINSIAIGAKPSSASAVFDQKLPQEASRVARLRAWQCEKCSDPECEHRLFTALTGSSARSA